MPAADARSPRVEAALVDEAHSAVEAEGPRPIGVASLIAALWATIIGLIVVVVPVLIGWAVAPGPASDPAEALRSSVHVWTAAHQVPVMVGEVTISLLPIGLLALPATLLFIVGSWAARATAPRTLGDALLLAGATSIAYGFMAVLVNAWASTDTASSVPWQTLVGAMVVAGGFVTLAVLRTSGFLSALVATIPRDWRALIAGSMTGLAVVMGGSALLAGIVLARQLDEAAGSYTVLKAGVMGTILLTIIAVAYVPNVVIWTASFAVGPGFAVGSGTQVTASVADTGSLPVFPLVAALPSDGAPPAAAAIIMLLPMLAAVAVGIVVARRMCADVPAARINPEHVAAWSAGAGAVGGLVLGILAQASAGSVGDGRLSDVGPSGWRVALMAAVTLAVVAAATGWLASRRRQGRVIVLPKGAASDEVRREPAAPIDMTLTAPIRFDEGGRV